MKRLVGASLLVAALAGCQARPVETVDASGMTAAPLGRADFTVRTVSRAASGLDLEVRGVSCLATSGSASASFVSPARVVLPDTGQGIRVVCEGGGRRGEALVEARQTFSSGGWRASPSLGVSVASGGRVGTGIGIGVSPVAVPSGIAYDDVRVVLR